VSYYTQRRLCLAQRVMLRRPPAHHVRVMARASRHASPVPHSDSPMQQLEYVRVDRGSAQPRRNGTSALVAFRVDPSVAQAIKFESDSGN
jgi:hypothetical protein